MANLIEGIQEECRHVREVLIPQYEAVGPAGAFGKLMLQKAVTEGEAAIASGDIVRMVTACKALQGWK